ncbi:MULTISPECIES: hypothetical protein [unclassified Microbacterium]|uniref:hypothetical protein n=1 Tax=unclassified Microbacterium TaxID=2609290 RepID=UPI0038653DB5
MPFHSYDTLRRWLSEFADERADASFVKVVPQDGSDGSDTGLITVPLFNATTTVYMQPNGSRWTTTIEPQPDETILGSDALHALAAELHMTGDLCAFLERRSADHFELPPAP